MDLRLSIFELSAYFCDMVHSQYTINFFLFIYKTPITSETASRNEVSEVVIVIAHRLTLRIAPDWLAGRLSGWLAD
jgi:hypothetical protein